jgi:hypothetical protein
MKLLLLPPSPEFANKQKYKTEIMFQISASAKAKKYGNFNFVPKENTDPYKLMGVKVEGLEQGAEKTPNVSKQQLVIIGVSLDHLSRSTQLLICCSGVFVFYLVYGFVQVVVYTICQIGVL